MVLEILSPYYLPNHASLSRAILDERVTAIDETCLPTLEGVQIFPNCVDTSVMRPVAPGDIRARYGIPEGGPIVLTVARLDADKSRYLAELVRAFVFALSFRPKTRLVIAGDGACRQRIESMARGMAFGRAHGIGPVVNREDLARLYSAASVFVGMGLSALEAAACGTLAVVINQRSLREPLYKNEWCVGVLGWDGYVGWGREMERTADLPTTLGKTLDIATGRLRSRGHAPNPRDAIAAYAAERVLADYEAWLLSKIASSP